MNHLKTAEMWESQSHLLNIVILYVFIINILLYGENFIFSRSITEFSSTELKDGCCSLILQMKIIKLVT